LSNIQGRARKESQEYIYMPKKQVHKENYNVILPNSVTSLGIKKRNYTDQQNEVFHIDVSQIIKDRRTSLMIKNIPNKYSQQLLKETIEVSHLEEYDFLYLPIDFKNKCNVGYAFINLKSPKAVLTFFRRFHNKRWEHFNSEKICEIAYARLQGYNALKKHFMTSSIKYQKDKRLKPLIY